jgi:hypothetical protein
MEAGLITPTPRPTLDYYRAALQPGAGNDIEGVSPLPRYHISARLNEAGDTLIGVMQIVVPNAGSDLVFRLYPNLSNYRGRARSTRLELTMPRPISSRWPIVQPFAWPCRLAASASSLSVTVDLSFKTHLQDQRRLINRIIRFSAGMARAESARFLPHLAVRQDGEWALDMPGPWRCAL